MALFPSNPKASYLAHKPDIDRAITGVLESGRYILGDQVSAFEKEFAEFIGVGFGVGVASGTDALHLALRANGVGPGDEVITVSHTAVASVAAIEQCGAVPVLLDIDDKTYTMRPDDLQSVLSPRTKALIPVHLYGHPADMDSIMQISEHYDLRVIEDCSQSHGATYNGKTTGALGHAGAFSFYPTKNLGAIGDAGMIVTDDVHIWERLNLLRQYGWKDRNESQLPGTNSRLDEIQAAILRIKLPWLRDANEKRRCIAGIYSKRLCTTRLHLPSRAGQTTHVYHQYVVRTRHRDHLRQYLKERGIETLIHYPIPIHRQPAYSGRIKCAASMVHTERVVTEILSLPIYPELSSESVHTVCDAVAAWQEK
jgi:dTDP-4-amino-4,6-dideoxygalactose transaminase